MSKTVDFKYAPMFQLGEDKTEYRLLSKEGVTTAEFEGKEIVKVSPEALTLLAQQAFQQKEVFNRNAGHYDDATIRHWLKTFLRRFFAQQFKRSCLPDGPKIGSVSLSPRGDWRMPSDAAANIWLRQTEELA